MARAEYIRSIFNYGAEILVDGRTGLPVGYSKNGIDQYFARFAVDGTSLVDGAGKPVTGGYPALKSGNNYEASLLNHASGVYIFVGYDPVDGVVWVRDDGGGSLRQGATSNAWSSTAGVTWTGARALPSSPNAVLYNHIVKLIRFKDYVYLLARDSVTSVHGVYRSAPIVGAGNFSWSAPVKQATSASASFIYTSMSADSSYLYLAEYGDQPGGPTSWRSADGVTWEQIYTEVGQGSPQRHIHAIAPDPYNVGHLWMTLGDANAPREIMRSVDYGSTWMVVSTNAKWQGVQISFSPSFVYIAGDSLNGIVMTVDRATNELAWASSGSLKNTPVARPAALGDEYYNNAWMGVVDPNTGEYYCSANDTSAAGNIPAIFCIPTRGAPPLLVEKGTSVMSPIDIAAGFLWFGKYRRPLHTI